METYWPSFYAFVTMTQEKLSICIWYQTYGGRLLGIFIKNREQGILDFDFDPLPLLIFFYFFVFSLTW